MSATTVGQAERETGRGTGNSCEGPSTRPARRLSTLDQVPASGFHIEPQAGLKVSTNAVGVGLPYSVLFRALYRCSAILRRASP